jgi:DNA-binding winged helix-turn-helix (wHTH) protein
MKQALASEHFAAYSPPANHCCGRKGGQACGALKTHSKGPRSTAVTLDSTKQAVGREEVESFLSVVEVERTRSRAVAIVRQDPFRASTSERSCHHEQRPVLSFPPFRLDVADERLWKHGRELRLRPKPFAILRYLTQHPRRLVRQSEIVDAVWGRIATSESLVRTHVRDLRRVMGEGVIETVVGRGYRFLADVSEIDEARNGSGLAASESPSPGRADGVTEPVRPADNARMLKELTDTLTTLGINAVLLFVGDEQGERIATLLGAVATEEKSVAVRLPVPDVVAAAAHGREGRACRRGGRELFPASEFIMRLVKDKNAAISTLVSLHVPALPGE